MIFNSTVFLYLFLPITWLVFRSLRNRSHRHVWLTITGYVFYAAWNYRFCALMALSTAVSYTAGLGFLRWQDPRRRRLCLVLPITFDLALLGVFKYADFALGSVRNLAAAFGVPLDVPTLAIVLPVGISFYTFHTITYIVDSYRRTIVPTRDFFEFSCYVSLFSQLVAGPIVRFRQIEGDLDHIDRPADPEMWTRGWSFFAIGMIKKVLIADTLAACVNPALAHWTALSTAGAWLAALGYTYQLYFDFSGYSDMAVGLGLLFGLRLPQNFNSPYQAVDIADFWRRWHISLSTVLRDYLYIPLGGNRRGRVRTYANIMTTMLLGGLWHGANWTFVCWGGYHGVLLGLTRLAGRRLERVPVGLRRAVTFLLVVVGWVLFRSRDFGMAAGLLRRMFGWRAGAAPEGWPLLLGVLLVAAAVSHWSRNSFEMSHRWGRAGTVALAALFALCLAFIYAGQNAPFLYFQF